MVSSDMCLCPATKNFVQYQKLFLMFLDSFLLDAVHEKGQGGFLLLLIVCQ